MRQSTPKVESPEGFDPVAVLDGSPVLAPLSDANRRSLAEIAISRRFERGDEIVPQGETSNRFYVVASGRVKMLRSLPNGRRVVLSVFGPGQLFGVADAIGRQASRGAHLALTEAVSCLEIGRAELFRLLGQQVDLAANLLVALTPHFSECKNCIVELACLRVESRLARLLTKLATSTGYERDGGVFVPIVLSRQDLADMTGTTIETCIRIMSRWGKEGLVETRDDGFSIRDPEGLSRLSAG
ncbi:MAG: Crp/Fnr family transcriptional regulator [Thermoanaerobaculia bacterium]|nr:Crp/Fnr family transcriptional regulator [Thermoanaerobaculia bacterium]